jgi:hypothetical protein
MRYRLAVEDMESDHWIAWVLDLPACFSSARTQTDAVARSPGCITEYYTWLKGHDGSLPAMVEPVEVEIVETFHSFPCSDDPDYLVNAFFDDDRRSLDYWTVEITLRLLQWTRQDLLKVVQPVSKEQLNKPVAGELRGSIAGLLEHVAFAENWYFDQIGLGLNQAQLPDDPFDMLSVVRANTRAHLVKLIGDERIYKDRDESWSARKVIRRTLWHERDHTRHILKLLNGL